MKYISGRLFYGRGHSVVLSFYFGGSQQLLGCGLQVFPTGMNRKKDTFFSSYRLLSIGNTEVQLVWVSFYLKTCK